MGKAPHHPNKSFCCFQICWPVWWGGCREIVMNSVLSSGGIKSESCGGFNILHSFCGGFDFRSVFKHIELLRFRMTTSSATAHASKNIKFARILRGWGGIVSRTRRQRNFRLGSATWQYAFPPGRRRPFQAADGKVCRRTSRRSGGRTKIK